MAEITAQRVADYIIHFFHEHGDPITNLKLQKLIYYTQGWHLGIHERPLFDDRLEAWLHGPVQPTLYHALKTYRWNPISEDPGEVLLPRTVKAHIDEVLEEYGGKSAYELERLTHAEDPWLNARGEAQMDEPSEAVISQQDMKDYFRAMLDEQN